MVIEIRIFESIQAKKFSSNLNLRVEKLNPRVENLNPRVENMNPGL